MKLIILKCPNCGAYVDVREGSKRAVCEFCDTPFYVEDDNKTVKTTAINEEKPTSDKASDTISDTSYTHKDDSFSTQPANPANKRKWISTLGVFIVALIIAAATGFSWLFFVILVSGIIGLFMSRPGRASSGRSLPLTNEICSEKSQVIALILCIVFGVFGVHYFYVGRVGMGLLYLFTIGFFGIGWLIDVIRISAGIFRDRDGYYLRA